MADSFWSALSGMGFVTIVNIVTIAYFYGKLCGRVDGLTWKVGELWKRVFKEDD